MKLAALLVLLWSAVVEAVVHLQRRERQGTTMSELFPFYHSTEDLRNELQRLAGSCPGMSLQSFPGPSGDQDRTIDVVTVRKPGASPTNKNFLLFGEHSRELISPESGLHFLKSLCGETSLSERAQSILDDSEFQIVVNGNPGSRREVEGGKFCLRTNPNGVDLNRNWDEHWQPEHEEETIMSNTNPGAQPFSEFETQTFKALVQEYKPTTFLTIHSGTKGMYMPWAFDTEHLAQRNQPEMMQILTDLDQNHCQCPFGAAGKEVGYSCPGTCLDWVYEQLQAQYAFAFEIYVGNGKHEELQRRWKEKMAASQGSFLQSHSHLADDHFKGLFEAHPSSFVQVKADDAWGPDEGPPWCFKQFNPSTPEEYQQVVENWSGAYLDMASLVSANLKRGAAGNTTDGQVGVRV